MKRGEEQQAIPLLYTRTLRCQLCGTKNRLHVVAWSRFSPPGGSLPQHIIIAARFQPVNTTISSKPEQNLDTRVRARACTRVRACGRGSTRGAEECERVCGQKMTAVRNGLQSLVEALTVPVSMKHWPPSKKTLYEALRGLQGLLGASQDAEPSASCLRLPEAA